VINFSKGTVKGFAAVIKETNKEKLAPKELTDVQTEAKKYW
jgi:hypothetical protein